MTSPSSIQSKFCVGDIISFLDITLTSQSIVFGIVVKVVPIKSNFVFSLHNCKNEAIPIDPHKNNYHYTVMSNQGTYFLLSGDSKHLEYKLITNL